MRTIIAGSRDLTDVKLVESHINSCPWIAEISSVLDGGATGVDAIGKQWALNYSIPVVSFPADWTKYGKKAGSIRNAQMAMNADALICIHRGTPGSRDMLKKAAQAKLRVFSVYLH